MFYQVLDSYYENILEVKPSDLCIIFLVLSIGLIMATPAPNTPEEEIVGLLRATSTHSADAFFKSAMLICDPDKEADLWSVQALSLMSVYNLAVCRNEAAYFSHGKYWLSP